jgi:hypothetical protein
MGLPLCVYFWIDLPVVSVSVVITVRVAAAIPMSMTIFVVCVTAAAPVVAMILVLSVVIAVVMVVLFVEFVPMKSMFPAAVSAPVRTLAASRERSPIAEARIVVVIDISVKTLRPAEPWPGAQKHAS